MLSKLRESRNMISNYPFLTTAWISLPDELYIGEISISRYTLRILLNMNAESKFD